MLALAVNAQSPGLQSTAHSAATTPVAATLRETTALRAELDQAAREASLPRPASKPLAGALATSSLPAAPIAVGSAVGGGPSYGSWAALALLGAGVGGWSVWKRRQRARTSLLSIRETAPLGRGKLLAVVDTGGRRLLIGVTEQGMQLLANEAQPAESLAVLTRTPDAPTAPNGGRFDDHLPPLEGEELRKKLAARFA